MLKGVIFDLDGILVDTEHLQWQGWLEVLKPFEISLSKEDYLKYAGKAGTISESELIKDFNLNIKKGLLLKKKEDLLLEWLRKKPIKTLPFAKGAVQFFVRHGIKIAIVSGGPKDEVEFKLKRIGLRPIINVVISGNEVRKGKPYPDIYLLGLKKLSLNPEDCLSFEDTQYGIESAKSAGLTCLAIPNEFSQKQDFSKANGIFGNLKEAIDWIKENYDF